MKKGRMISAALIIMLTTVIFGMSGDGGNVPVVPKKETLKETPQESLGSDNTGVLEQTELLKESTTVKDRLGFDSEMTKSNFQEFEANYYNKCHEVGISKGKFVAPGSYFKYKININAAEELKTLGLFLTKDPNNLEEDLAFFITHSDVILIGSVEKIEFLYESKEEEYNASGARSEYTIKIDNILKGQDLFEKIPKEIKYHNMFGKYIVTSNDDKQDLNGKYFFFFQLYDGKIENLIRIRNSSLKIINDEAFSVFSNKSALKPAKDLISIIEKYNEINNSRDFYKRNYLKAEVKNEK